MFLSYHSGGKDSLLAHVHCIARGHVPVCVAMLVNKVGGPIDLNSHAFQTVTHEVADAIGECLELPVIKRELTGKSVCTEMEYTATEADEVEDLKSVLMTAKVCAPPY